MKNVKMRVAYPNELWHYGVKGMKWGVRRYQNYDGTLTELGKHRYKYKDDPINVDPKTGDIKMVRDVVQKALDSGVVITKISEKNQAKHLKDGKEYVESRSFMYGTMEDCQKWIDSLSGTGLSVPTNRKTWTRKERVEANELIGEFIDQETGLQTPTKKAMIVYSKKGSHIYPRE